MDSQESRAGVKFETFKILEDRPTDQGDEFGGDTAASKREITISSAVTRQKVAAAKQFIENHYKNQNQNLQERKERQIISIAEILQINNVKGRSGEEEENETEKNMGTLLQIKAFQAAC
eukprot:Gb_27050 [translate_table: standard]